MSGRWHNAAARGLMVIALAFVGAGCAAVQPLSVTVRSVDAASVSDDGICFNLQCAVSNPNQEIVPVRRATFNLTAGGRAVVQGSDELHRSMSPGETATLDVPIAIPFENLTENAAAVRASNGDLLYDIDGEIEAGDSWHRTRTPLTYRGTLPLRQLMK